MQISAINSYNNFKGSGEVVDLVQNEAGIYDRPTGLSDKLDRVDFSSIADLINDSKPENKKDSPAKFFLTTVLYAAAAFYAAKKMSVGALKKITQKLSLEKPLYNLGAIVHRGVTSLKGRPVPEVTNVSSFFTRNTNKALGAFATAMEGIAKKGVTQAEQEAFFKLMGKGAQKGALYAGNGILKATGATLGVGTAGVTVLNRYRDEDGNGVPDKLEKTKNGFSLLNECKEALPKLATICDCIG